jgi:hypothetical protein
LKNQKNSHGGLKSLYETVDLNDTRYYGVFLYGPPDKKRVKVDPKRYGQVLYLTDAMKAVMDKRHGPYFRPAKREFTDYNCNFVGQELNALRMDWEKDTKPMIARVIAETKGVDYNANPCDDDLANAGILEPEEITRNASMKTMFSAQMAADKRNKLYYSLYAQFFHQMASQIEALTVNLLTRNEWKENQFDRNVFYAFKGNKPGDVKKLDGFAAYDKLYAIWNFIKHNSGSTYAVLKERFPEVLSENEYKQGRLACYYVKFDDALIDGVLAGVETFLRGYCCLVFDEDLEQARWNYDEYFLNQIHEDIEAAVNPLGLPWWI